MRDQAEDSSSNIWASLLKEVHLNASHRINSYGTSESINKPQLILLGNELCGKTKLVESFLNNELECGVGLDYQFITLSEEGRDETLHMGVWSLDKDAQQSGLLKFALNESNIWHSMILICASYTEPWSLLNELEMWLEILEQHLARLKLDNEEMEILKSSVKYGFQMYTDLIHCENNIEISSTFETTNKSINSRPQKCVSNPPRYVENRWPFSPLHPLPTDLNESLNSDNTTNTTTNTNTTEFMLNKILPVPIMIVITKTDMLSYLEKEYNFTDEKFDFIQYHLRKLCLKYGASLIYTSIKEAINTERILDYIKHRLFEAPLRSAAMLVESKGIFIPSGWDNEHRLELFKKNLQPNLIDSPYNSVIPKPSRFRRKRSSLGRSTGSESNTNDELSLIQMAEDEQIFLGRMQTMLANMPTPTSTGSMSGGSTPSIAGNVGFPGQTRDSNILSDNSPIMNLSGQTKLAGGMSEKEAVLSSFFNSLLARKSLGESVSPNQTNPTTTPPNINNNNNNNSNASCKSTPNDSPTKPG